MDVGSVTVDLIKARIQQVEKQLADHKAILREREASKEKEFREYKELERSKSKKLFARFVPGGTSALDKSKSKEASEWQEAQTLENQQRDIVNRLDDTLRVLEKMMVELSQDPSKVAELTQKFNRLDLSSSDPQQYKPHQARPTSLQSRPSLRQSDPAKIEPFSLPPLEETRPLNIRRNGVGGSLRVVPEQGTTALPQRSASQRSPSSPTGKPITPIPMYDFNGRVISPLNETSPTDPPPPPPKPISASPTALPPPLPSGPGVESPPVSGPPSYPAGASRPPYLDAGGTYPGAPPPSGQPFESQPPYLSNPPADTPPYESANQRSSRSPSPSRPRPPLPVSPQQSSYPGGPAAAQPPPPPASHAPAPYLQQGPTLSPYPPDESYTPGGFVMPTPSFGTYQHPMMQGFYQPGPPQPPAPGPRPAIPTPSFPSAWSPNPPQDSGYPSRGW